VGSAGGGEARARRPNRGAEAAAHHATSSLSNQELINQIEIIRNGGALLSPQVALKLFKQIQKQTVALETSNYGFTPREKQVVDELLKGLSYKEIAQVLGISSTTVNDHLKNVYPKMGVRTKAELMRKILKT
jgi:DNA-binding NarL/FixJ family response regulator